MSQSSGGHGTLSVITALSCNTFITVIKFIGWFLSGSGAMFSEAVHSMADASNQALLLLGIKRSQKASDASFNYGYGQERYFWALVSACGVFFIGCGVTVYHGVHSLFLKDHPEINYITFAILGVSLVLEAISFWVAIKEIKGATGKSLRESIKEADSTTLAILLEDGVALLGVILAFASIILTKVTGYYLWDSICSIIIGLLLGVVAIILADVNRKYLIEQAMPKSVEEELVKVVKNTGLVAGISQIRSSTVTTGAYRVRFEVDLNESCLDNCDITQKSVALDEIGAKIKEIKDGVQSALPCVKYLTVELGCSKDSKS